MLRHVHMKHAGKARQLSKGEQRERLAQRMVQMQAADDLAIVYATLKVNAHALPAVKSTLKALGIELENPQSRRKREASKDDDSDVGSGEGTQRALPVTPGSATEPHDDGTLPCPPVFPSAVPPYTRSRTWSCFDCRHQKRRELQASVRPMILHLFVHLELGEAWVGGAGAAGFTIDPFRSDFPRSVVRVLSNHSMTGCFFHKSVGGGFWGSSCSSSPKL